MALSEKPANDAEAAKMPALRNRTGDFRRVAEKGRQVACATRGLFLVDAGGLGYYVQSDCPVGTVPE